MAARKPKGGATARTKRDSGSDSVFSSPREKADFQKQIAAEKESSTIVSRMQRMRNEMGITVGGGSTPAPSISDVAETSDTSATGASGTASSSSSGRR